MIEYLNTMNYGFFLLLYLGIGIIISSLVVAFTKSWIDDIFQFFVVVWFWPFVVPLYFINKCIKWLRVLRSRLKYFKEKE